MKVSILGLIAAAGLTTLVSSANAQTFYNVATVDLSTTFNSGTGNGANPGTMAWDGSSLFVAGFNNTGAAGSVAAVKVSNVLALPSIGSPFGVLASVPAGRGYISADTSGGNVVFAADSGAVGTSLISSYATSNLALNFSKAPAGRPHVVGIDPIAGTGGVNTNVNSLVQGFGAMRRDNITSGTADTNISITSGDAGSTAWRDLDFAPNGDAWMRVQNRVSVATRSGPGGFNAGAVVVGLTASNQAGEGIAYLSGLSGGDRVIYNNRASTGSGQAFNTVTLASTTAGAASPLNFFDSTGTNPFAAASGAAWYDYSWDAASQTLAILDFSNRQVYIFSTTAVPAPASVGLLGLAGGMMMKRRRRTA